MFNGEIISADSRQVYRFMDVGTSKPSMSQQGTIQHHLLDVVDPDGEFTLAQFLNDTKIAVSDIRSRNKLPIVVGGTGQYIMAFLEGWQVPNVPPNPILRNNLEKQAKEHGALHIYSQLQRLDPITASSIDYRNVRRVIRALETCISTGAPSRNIRNKIPLNDRTLVIGLTTPRDKLYKRIDTRVDKMMRNGLEEEVASLINKGYRSSLASMSSLGYREMALYINDSITYDAAVQKMKYETHRFARNQYTWFSLKDSRIRWLNQNCSLVTLASEVVENFLY